MVIVCGNDGHRPVTVMFTSCALCWLQAVIFVATRRDRITSSEKEQYSAFGTRFGRKNRRPERTRSNRGRVYVKRGSIQLEEGQAAGGRA
jgi:hypothetical protein